MAEDFNYKNRVRSYEVSIWTLQDRFLSVLKWSEMDCKGQIQEPEVVLRDDGTQEFTFSIPRYYQNGLSRIENPMWLHLENQPLEANMHKLKIIFNKNTEDEKVFEFLVTEVTYDHTQDNVMLTVKTEGLAFHELGKIGYKISLSETDYTNALDKWERDGFLYEEPRNNIQFWNDLVFKNKKGEWRTNWTYEINMDWSAFSALNGIIEKDPHVLYEDEYVSSWTVNEETMTMEPKEVQETHEKYRIIETSESNIYNITQTIAEQFGVFCRYEYIHDTNYQIIGRKVIYYNNYLQDTLGHIDLTYPYTSTAITRTVDSSNITTKMYVTGVDYDSDTVHIMDVEANKSKEDYLLSFDYLHDIQAINDDQYSEIENYEATIRLLNDRIIKVQERIRIISEQLTEAEANLTTYTNAVKEDDAKYNDAFKAALAVTGGEGVAKLEAKPIVLMHNDTEGYYVNIKYDGLVRGTIKLYRINTYVPKEPNKDLESACEELIPSFNIVTDEFDNIIRLNHITGNNKLQDTTTVYLFADWDPRTAYVKVYERWDKRKALDQAALEEYKQKVLDYTWYLHGSRVDYALADYCKLGVAKFPLAVAWGEEEEMEIPHVYWSDIVDQGRIISSPEEFAEHGPGINAWIYDYFKQLDEESTTADLLYYQDAYIEDKNEHISAFERLMGPALREGYWNPENYHDYGDLFKDEFALGAAENLESVLPKTQFLQLMWDGDKYYDPEEPFIYNAGIDGSVERHLAIRLTNEDLEMIKDKLDDVCFVYRQPSNVIAIQQAQAKGEVDEIWMETLEKTMYSYYRVGGGCELGWILDKTNQNNPIRVPVLIVTGAKELNDDLINYIVTGNYAVSEINEDYARIEHNSKPLNSYSSFIGIVTKDKDNEEKEESYPGLWTIVEKIGGENPTRVIGYTSGTYARKIGMIKDKNNIDRYPTPQEYDYTRVYPRLYFNTLKLKYEELKILKGNSPLIENQDYYTLQDDRSKGLVVNGVGYYTTLKPHVLYSSGKMKSYFSIVYTLSNIDTSIYLDALAVAYENSRPKVSYNVELSVLYPQYIHTLYDRLNQIVHINDIDLKLENVSGYISTVTMKLDRLWEDTVEIKNYETKFEDLFSTIVAQTEAMKSSQMGLNKAIAAFTSTGLISDKIMERSFKGADLDWAFDQGKLTIDQDEGIWGTTYENGIPSGVVAFRGGGIFTATQQDENGRWIWNTGILPSGINANLITSGQIDTGKIRIFSGDELRFQWNAEGLYAYKSAILTTNDVQGSSAIRVDPLQYVLYNSEGLFLRGEKGLVRKTGVEPLSENVDRVEISWNGLILRNWDNEQVFYADPDTGNLTLAGTIIAESGEIGGWRIDTNLLTSDNINLVSKSEDGKQDVQPGIYLTNSKQNSIQSISDNGQIYYAYTYGNDNTCYIANFLRLTNFTVGELDSPIIKSYQPVITAVQPKYTYTAVIETSTSTNPETHNGTGEFNEASGSNRTSNYQTDGNVTITTSSVIYIVGSKNSTTPLKDVNGNSITYNYDTSPTDSNSWYSKMRAKGYDSLINITTVNQLKPLLTLSADTVLHPSAFVPTFSLRAEDGHIEMNNGIMGNFIFNNTGLSGGILKGTQLDADNYIKINSKDYSLSEYGRCFTGFSANSSAGTFTLTRINGETVNFNIASMAAYQKAREAAGTIKSVTWNHNNETCSVTITTGYGTRQTFTTGISDVFENGKANGSYNGIKLNAISADVSVTMNQGSGYVTANAIGYALVNGSVQKERHRSYTVSVPKASRSTGGCFSAGTLVTLADGSYCPIEKLMLGTYIKAYNEEEQKFYTGKVILVEARGLDQPKDMVDIYLTSGKIITATTTHPFLTESGWCAVNPELASQEYQVGSWISTLEENDILINDQKNQIKVEKIVQRPDLSNVPVYHIGIDKYHTFLVENVVVHNAKAEY